MNAQRLDEILARFPKTTVLVVGDFFLDKYLDIEQRLSEVSLETGLEAHQVVEVRCCPGAAGAVTNNLRAMEVNTIGLGVLGDDGEGYELKRALRRTGVVTDFLIQRPDRVTPTYTKPMLRAAGRPARELNRLDIQNRAPLPADAEAELLRRLRELVPRAQGVVIADQVAEADCGAITRRVREELAALARAHPRVVFVADSRERIGLFREILLKPNAREAVKALHPGENADPDRARAEANGAELFQRNGKPVFLTLGADGILVFQPGGAVHVPSVRVEGPIDIVGAGDATLAGIVSALCAGATPAEAACVGTLAAAVTLRQLGTTGTASRAQMRACL